MIVSFLWEQARDLSNNQALWRKTSPALGVSTYTLNSAIQLGEGTGPTVVNTSLSSLSSPDASIGLIAGIATGLIENAAKTGWVKVIQGFIAGKQFILYRATTYVGSSPDCHIYLFKDPQVGRRHAAVHVSPQGFELEDLPLGSKTLVNGRPAQRVKLKNGDRIQVGATAFVFQAKAKTA